MAISYEDKSNVQSIFQNFHKMIVNQFGVSIRRLRSDNGKEYFNQYLDHFFQTQGIIHESSCVDTPQQNGVAERKNRYLLNVTWALLFQMSVPKHFWGEAVLTSAYLINRVLSKTFGNKSPLQLLSTFYPDVSHKYHISPRVFGCVAFVHIHNHNRFKLDPRALKCLYWVF